MLIKKKKCPHCDPFPYDNRLHFFGSLGRIVFPIQFFLDNIDFYFRHRIGFSRLARLLSQIFIGGLIRILIFLGILRETEIFTDNEQLPSRIIPIIQAANERGMVIRALKLFNKQYTNIFSLTANSKKVIFEGLPLYNINDIIPHNFDDKFRLKQILKENSMPHPEGYAMHSFKNVLFYAKRLNFPLVVKPRYGSLSKHTVCNIRNEQTLIEAVRVVREISYEFILEKFIPGNVYRITVVNNDFIACCLREPPNVIGDGIHTIEELVKIKNNNPLRGGMNQKNFTLRRILLNGKSFSLLEKQGLTVKSVLQKNTKVYLNDKVVLACGTDIHDETDNIHPDNKYLFLKLAHMLESPIVGIDFIGQDISRQYHRQSCAIIEVNSLPYIDMHHFPVSGKPRDIAGYILDNNVFLH